jgi:heterogeneous nuclear ribonucleoprotein R
VDLEGDDDGMEDDDGGYRRRGSRDDSEEPEEDDDNDERHGDGDGRGDDDAGMEPEPEPAGGGGKGGDETGKGADAAEGSEPEDEEERSKWDELLALPPHGSQVFIGGLPRDTTEDDLRELCEPLGEIYEVSFTRHTNQSSCFLPSACYMHGVVMCVSVCAANRMAGEIDQKGRQREQGVRLCHLH